MPSTIPYDPSLVLANVVSNEALNVVEAISKAQAPADAAQEDLNSLLASRRSLDMTKTELMNLGIDTTDLAKAIDDINGNLGKSAAAYAAAKAKAESEIQPLRAQISMVHAQVESPVDYVKTQIKTMPLAADSLSMDVQYFSRDVNKQDASSFSGAVSSFVSASTSWMGIKYSAEMSAAASRQVTEQVQQHSIEGTLVLSVACTHKNAAILAPFVLNVDKGIKVWNHLFPDDKIVITDRNQMMQLANTNGGQDDKKFSILSGTTFGSSFVGMVHVLNTTDTKVSDDMSSFASSSKMMAQSAWFENVSGGIGVNQSMANNVKNMLSTQNITSHVTLITTGVIPSVVANDVKMAVKEFADFNPQKNMEAVATIENATQNSQGSMDSAAEASRTGGKMMAVKQNDIKSALSGVAEIDDGKNKILDINSMMTALDDYLKKAQSGNCGVPINYYLKDITKDLLAEMWVAKYFPGQSMPITYDDTTPTAAGTGGTASTS